MLDYFFFPNFLSEISKLYSNSNLQLNPKPNFNLICENNIVITFLILCCVFVKLIEISQGNQARSRTENLGNSRSRSLSSLYPPLKRTERDLGPKI
jgi:hypothetical protein